MRLRVNFTDGDSQDQNKYGSTHSTSYNKSENASLIESRTHLMLIVTVFAGWLSAVSLISTSPRPIRLRDNRTFA